MKIANESFAGHRRPVVIAHPEIIIVGFGELILSVNANYSYSLRTVRQGHKSGMYLAGDARAELGSFKIPTHRRDNSMTVRSIRLNSYAEVTAAVILFYHYIFKSSVTRFIKV